MNNISGLKSKILTTSAEASKPAPTAGPDINISSQLEEIQNKIQSVNQPTLPSRDIVTIYNAVPNPNAPSFYPQNYIPAYPKPTTTPKPPIKASIQPLSPTVDQSVAPSYTIKPSTQDILPIIPQKITKSHQSAENSVASTVSHQKQHTKYQHSPQPINQYQKNTISQKQGSASKPQYQSKDLVPRNAPDSQNYKKTAKYGKKQGKTDNQNLFPSIDQAKKKKQGKQDEKRRLELQKVEKEQKYQQNHNVYHKDDDNCEAFDRFDYEQHFPHHLPHPPFGHYPLPPPNITHLPPGHHYPPPPGFYPPPPHMMSPPHPYHPFPPPMPPQAPIGPNGEQPTMYSIIPQADGTFQYVFYTLVTDSDEDSEYYEEDSDIYAQNQPETLEKETETQSISIPVTISQAAPQTIIMPQTRVVVAQPVAPLPPTTTSSNTKQNLPKTEKMKTNKKLPVSLPPPVQQFTAPVPPLTTTSPTPHSHVRSTNSSALYKTIISLPEEDNLSNDDFLGTLMSADDAMVDQLLGNVPKTAASQPREIVNPIYQSCPVRIEGQELYLQQDNSSMITNCQNVDQFALSQQHIKLVNSFFNPSRPTRKNYKVRSLNGDNPFQQLTLAELNALEAQVRGTLQQIHAQEQEIKKDAVQEAYLWEQQRQQQEVILKAIYQQRHGIVTDKVNVSTHENVVNSQQTIRDEYYLLNASKEEGHCVDEERFAQLQAQIELSQFKSSVKLSKMSNSYREKHVEKVSKNNTKILSNATEKIKNMGVEGYKEYLQAQIKINMLEHLAIADTSVNPGETDELPKKMLVPKKLKQYNASNNRFGDLIDDDE